MYLARYLSSHTDFKSTATEWISTKYQQRDSRPLKELNCTSQKLSTKATMDYVLKVVTLALFLKNAVGHTSVHEDLRTDVNIEM